jgi:hypothetical protein
MGLYHAGMAGPVVDLAQRRYENALALFDEFVRAAVRDPDAATLRGLERRFAERLEIQPSYWSQIKSRARQIGERLARQFEQRCHKPVGWMDQAHGPARGQPGDGAEDTGPRDDDERFIVGLVLSYYRRDPQRARTRLLGLLGEALAPAPGAPAPAGRAAPSPGAAPARPPADDAHALWLRSAAGVAPLKRKR